MLKTQINIDALRVSINTQAPSEIQIAPSGIFRAVDGRPEKLNGWHIDDKAKTIIDAFNRLTNDAVIDYEHQTLYSQDNGQPAPAAGWITNLFWRDNVGLFADVKWTKKAKKLIKNGSYRFISPVLESNKKTGEVISVAMAALVNAPGIDGMQELSALANKLFLKNTGKKMNIKLMELLKLYNDATDDDANNAVQALLDKNASLSKESDALKVNPDPAKFVDLKTVNETITALKSELTTLKSDFAKNEVEAVVADALSDGRLLPAQSAWAKSLGESDLESLKTFVSNSQPINALKTEQTKGIDTPEKSTEILTETEKEMCEKLSISHVDFLKAKTKNGDQ